MKPWPRHPLIYEINTWVWLNDLGVKYGGPVTLSSVPHAEWESLFSLGVDAIWFMGVWERSPSGIRVALNNEGLMADFRRALPDFRADDVIGSPYCVKRYVVDNRLGGPEGLASARNILTGQGVRLILDFVPNHVAPDHHWVVEHPEYFIRGDAGDLQKDPASFLEIEGTVFACGRDPYFPAWPDVLQLNGFDAGLRKAVIDTMSEIAGQCDGIRCDMAMLMLNDIFARTWGRRAGERPDRDYWAALIPAIKEKRPDFRFIAEAYWDLEWELQQQGFDYCYDKKLYDRMEHGNAEDIRLHLCADLAYQERLVRFIENHDEPRASATFGPGKDRAAAVAALTLMGARLLHEGQAQGMKVRLPVFLGRRPVQLIDQDLSEFYGRLLRALNTDVLRNGHWRLCDRNGWPDNQGCLDILAWCWAKEDERCLIVVNFSGGAVQARVVVPWDELRGRRWRLTDALSGDIYERAGDEMRDPGLYVDLTPWKCNLFFLDEL